MLLLCICYFYHLSLILIKTLSLFILTMQSNFLVKLLKSHIKWILIIILHWNCTWLLWWWWWLYVCNSKFNWMSFWEKSHFWCFGNFSFSGLKFIHTWFVEYHSTYFEEILTISRKCSPFHFLYLIYFHFRFHLNLLKSAIKC
jgi:hypothetical protein